MMVALLRANASAFIDGNIHQLKRGAILRIPGSNELAALSASDAAAIVREQTEAWQSGREPQLQPIDSRSVTAAAPGRAAPAADGRLSIVPPSGAQARASQSGASAAGEGTELRAELSEARENLAARDGEIKELRSRVADLEKLRESNTKLVALKDSELAALQQRLRELEQARTTDAERAASEQPADATVAADGDAAAADTTAADAGAGVGPEAPAPTVTPAPVASDTAPSPAAELPPAPAATPWYTQTMSRAGFAVLLVGLLSLLLLRRKPKVSATLGAPRKRGSDASSLAASIDALRASPEAVAAQDADSSLGADDEHLRELRANVVTRPDQLEAHLALLRYLHAHDMAGSFEDAATDMLPHVLDPNGPQWREACALGNSLMPDNALFDIAAAQSGDYPADEDELARLAAEDVATNAESTDASPPDHEVDFERALVEFDVGHAKPGSASASAWDDTEATASADASPARDAPVADADDDTLGGDADGAGDAAETKLDLAQAYIDIGDSEAAHALLDEVLTEGNPSQRLRAERLLADLR
jgi:pilus assembly protein FimV